MSKRRKAARPPDQRTDHGTPETRAKLRRDGIRELEARSPQWRPEYRTAADEIREIYLAVIGGLMSRAQRFDRVDLGKPIGIPEGLARLHRDRYLPWAQALSVRHALNGPPVLEVVIDAVVEGETVSSIAARRRHRKGHVTMWIIDGLALYARGVRRQQRAA
jgi:hypothetical protein